MHAAAHAFENASGHKIMFSTTPQLQKYVAAGDTFDVISAPPTATAVRSYN